jgi:hypothetical protein
MKMNTNRSDGANKTTKSAPKAAPRKKADAADCTNCLHYDYDEESEEHSCRMMLDEDEYWRLLSDDYYVCPYYRKHDEYKSARMQN